jgi:hypothetical protein
MYASYASLEEVYGESFEPFQDVGPLPSKPKDRPDPSLHQDSLSSSTHSSACHYISSHIDHCSFCRGKTKHESPELQPILALFHNWLPYIQWIKWLVVAIIILIICNVVSFLAITGTRIRWI